MRRSIYLIILFIGLLSGYSNPAAAQFWKKWFKKEQPKRKLPPKKPAAKDKPKPVKKKHEVTYPATQMKPRYRVDVFAQLYLDELVKGGKATFKGKLPVKAAAGMEFYEGVKIAADTLSSFSFAIDVYMHDVMDVKATPDILIKNKALDSTDLIIGAVPSQYIPALAAFAKNRQVNFISALSPSDADVKDNPYFTLLQPSLQTHCEAIMKALAKKNVRKPVLFYRDNPGVDHNAFNYLTGYSTNTDLRKILVNTVPAKEQLKGAFDSASVNTIVIAVLDNAYANKLLKQINLLYPGYRFEVYGMPSWSGMASLKKTDEYPNITIYVTEPFFYDMTTAAGQALSGIYKKEYGNNHPGDLVYRGYETMYWYAYLLNKYGTIFNEKTADNGVAPFTRFDIKPQWDKDDNLLYNENQHLYFYRYSDGSFMLE